MARPLRFTTLTPKLSLITIWSFHQSQARLTDKAPFASRCYPAK